MDSRSRSNLSRRDFLGVVGSTLVAAACRRELYRASDFVIPARSSVCLCPAADYSQDFGEIIGRGMRELGVDVRGRRVLLKPNMVEFEKGSSINTHPLVVAGAAEACLRAGAREVVVGEGPGHRRDIEYLLLGTGLLDHLRDLKVRFVDLNLCAVRQVPLRSRFTGASSLWLPTELLAADVFISMPKLKTHHWAGLTAGMKNLFGVVPGAIYGWPKNILHQMGIENSIIDLNSTVRPHLVIVDGVIGMEGDGPIMGRSKPVGFIGLGTDPVAMDATCARIMEIVPERVPYLNIASRFLGNLDRSRIDQRGESIERYRTRFDLLPRLRILQDSV